MDHTDTVCAWKTWGKCGVCIGLKRNIRVKHEDFVNGMTKYSRASKLQYGQRVGTTILVVNGKEF